jgi:hypothetical protein
MKMWPSTNLSDCCWLATTFTMGREPATRSATSRVATMAAAAPEPAPQAIFEVWG